MEDFQENIKTLLNNKEEIKKIAESTGQGIEATTKILEKILETPDISEQAKNYDEAAAADMAARMGKNATEADIENVANKMDSMNRGPLAKVWDKVTQLWKAFKSPETPASMKAIIIGGLIYMVSPIDLIPDAIPVVGLLDDVGVIMLVFRQFLRLTSADDLDFTINIEIKGVLTPKKLKEELKKRELGNAARAKLDSKDSDTVKVGLYDEDNNKVSTATVEADSISDELYEGKEIQLYD